MNPYSHIASNKAKTYFIMALFMLFVSGFFFLIGKYLGNGEGYLIGGFLFSLFSTVGSYFYSDKIVLATTGAKPATKAEYFDLYTVTENLAMADGIPMPKLYVINDPSPNAFATGRDPKHAVVAATTGLLERLDRAELEGVISHELSHVKNYDILVSSIVAVLVGSIGLIADWVMRSMFWGGNKDDARKQGGAVVFFLVIIAIILAPIVATLVQLAVSRRREYLADASGALLTRNPEGLASALEKISAAPPMHAATSSTAHLFIDNPFKQGGKAKSWIASLFSTHPPMEERVKILRSM